MRVRVLNVIGKPFRYEILAWCVERDIWITIGIADDREKAHKDAIEYSKRSAIAIEEAIFENGEQLFK